MNLWQQKKWAALQEKLGNTVFEVEGIFVIKKSLPFGWSMFEVQRANPRETFWKKIEEKAKKEKAIFCRISSNSEKLFIPEKYISKASILQRFPNATRIVDISQTEEEIFMQFSQTCRRHIRKAEKMGVTVEVVETQFIASEKNEENPIQKFSDLSAVTAKRDGFFAHGKKYFDTFLETLGDDAVLLVAKKNGKWLSAGIFCRECSRAFPTNQGDTAYYYYGASNNKERGTNAPTLLQWEVMKYFKKHGCTNFDLLGVAPENEPNNRLSGVTQFKKKFGGTVVHYAKEMNVLFSPWKYVLYRTAKTIRNFLR